MLAFKLVGLAYGIFLIAGAYFGWKAGSQVSLIMGLVSGCLALLCAYLLNTDSLLASRLLCAVSGLLTVTFFMRLMKTQKFMPSGMLLLISLIVVIFCISQMLKK